MTDFISATFGSSGTAVQMFGGQWWLVGMFLLLILVLFMVRYGVNSSGIIITTILGLVLVGVYEIFIIETAYIQAMLIFIFIFVGSILAFWITR